jgi:predicted transcriptional regulator
MKVAAQKFINAHKDYHTFLKLVGQNPGISYRELFRVSDPGYGTLEGHLALLERLGLLRVQRSGGFTRYYSPDVSKTDIELLCCLKHRAYREIIRLLLNDASDAFTFQEIVQMIGKAPSTVSVQLRRLIDHKLVSFDKKRGYYTVNNKQTIKRLISKYKV